MVERIKKFLNKLRLNLNKKTIIYALKDRFVSMVGYRIKDNVIMLRKPILKSFYQNRNVWGRLKYTNCVKIKYNKNTNKENSKIEREDKRMKLEHKEYTQEEINEIFDLSPLPNTLFEKKRLLQDIIVEDIKDDMRK